MAKMFMMSVIRKTSKCFLTVSLLVSLFGCAKSQDNGQNKIDGKSEPYTTQRQSNQVQQGSEGASTHQNSSAQQQTSASSSSKMSNGSTAPTKEMLHGLAVIPNDRMSTNHDIVLPITSIANQSYVKAKDIANALDFQTSWDAGKRKLNMGDTDVRFELYMGTQKARKDGKDVKVHQPFVMQNQESYLPVTTLRDLFQEDMYFDVADHEVRIHATPGLSVKSEDDPGDGKLNGDADFAEDPNTPTSEAKTSEVSAMKEDAGLSDDLDFAEDVDYATDDHASQETLKRINIDGLLREAQKYLGVKYQFGADDYEKSKRFDCSTYTQYIYRKQGLQLPRVAREQANQGDVVSRKTLRKGDLMFFYVPGRFKSNKVVGHVGIYMGGNRMIHAINKPQDGVQITEINKAYWKESFLFGKRVAQ